jgi:hypothetical protein
MHAAMHVDVDADETEPARLTVRLEGEGLGDSADLRLPSGPEGVDRRDAEALLRSQHPAHRLLVSETVVGQQHQRATQFTERFVVPQEVGGHFEDAVDAYGEQVSVLEEAPNASGAHTEDTHEIGNGEPRTA